MTARSLATGSWSLVRQTAAECRADRVSRLAAAVAFYAVFAVAPLLVIGTKVAGLLFGQDRSRQEAAARIRELLGAAPADAAQSLLDRAAAAQMSGTWPTLLGSAFLIYAVATMFAAIHDAMNTIWEVESADRTWGRWVLDRAGPYLMVLGAGVVLIASVAAGPVLAAVAPHLGGSAAVHRAARVGGSVLVFTAAFAAIFKGMSDVSIDWRDVGVGAAATAALFTAGELTLQWYLGRPAVNGVYGVAGAVGVVLLWVYYSAQVLFVGAEFTRVYARRVGRPLRPSRGAVRVEKRRPSRDNPNDQDGRHVDPPHAPDPAA